ncbi:MAG: carboxyl transferase domain-containing protein [Acidimicrobiales bacterium]
MSNGADDGAAEVATVDRLRALRQLASGNASQADRVGTSHAKGRSEALRHVDGLTDAGTFFEIGTFATFAEPVTQKGENHYGGGIVGGHATISGRPVTVAVDDGEVSGRATGKSSRLFDMALSRRNPYIEIAHGSSEPSFGGRLETGTLSAKTFRAEPAFPYLLQRNRFIPVVSAVLGDAFGSSSFTAGLCDFLVQKEGTHLGLVRPLSTEGDVFASPSAPVENKVSVANGEVDMVVRTDGEAYGAVRKFLSFLPSYSGGRLPIEEDDLAMNYDNGVAALVPSRRNRAYDMKDVIRRLGDPDSFFELKPNFARNIITGFGRVSGMPVGFIANAPMHSAGALTPDCCLKATSFVCMCDAFGIPMVFLIDTPGFLVSVSAERDRAMIRSMTMMQAIALATVPKISVVVRKGFGLAFVIMGGNRRSDLLVAWPGAEIGFMDPPVAANVLFEPQMRELPEEERPAFIANKVNQLAVDFEPYGVAASMVIDEIIEPGTTRQMIAEYFFTELNSDGRTRVQSPLANWPRWS